MAYPTVTQHSKLYPYTSIMASPYSCDPTGVLDCAAAIEQIKANQSNIGTIYIPHGTFLINTNLTIPATMALWFEKGAVLSIGAGKTLTVSGTILAGPFAIFAGAGAVNISTTTNTIIPGEWTGSTGLTLTGNIALTGNVALTGNLTLTGSTTLSALDSVGYVKTNASGVLSTGAIASADLPTATDVAQGAVELATNAETITGTDAGRVVTPAGLKAMVDGRAASQTDQEAGTEVAKYVSSATQQYHPSAAKVWAFFTVAGEVQASYNVASVVDNGSGDWTVNFTVPFSSGNYLALWGEAAGGSYEVNFFGYTWNAAYTRSKFLNDSGSVTESGGMVSVLCFGDQ